MALEWTLEAADNSAGTLISLFLACGLDPTISGKIQAEVDAHSSPSRLPSMEEARNMPYVEAVALELLVRLHTICLTSDAVDDDPCNSAGDRLYLLQFRTP